MEKTLNRIVYSFGQKTLSVFLAVAAAVVLPQMVHAIGVVTGTGALIGQILLPMYLPVLVFGFLAGPVAGATAGVLSPLISYAVSGMPSAVLLPYMVLELGCYGLFAGLIRKGRLHPMLKVLAVSLISRLLRLAVTAVAAGLINQPAVSIGATVHLMVLGLPGIALHCLMAPYLVKAMEKKQ